MVKMISDRQFEIWEGQITASPEIKTEPTNKLKNGPMHPAVAALYKRQRRTFGTEKCMQERKLSISSTDFNTLVHNLPIRGGNKYRNYAKLVRQKLGLGTKVSSPACDHGVFYEPEALRVYQLVTGNQIGSEVGWCRGPPAGHDQEAFRVPEYVGATPDGVCVNEAILVEIKCPYWKREIKGGIPEIYW